MAPGATSGPRTAPVAGVAPLQQRYRLLVAALRAFALIVLLAEPTRAREEEADTVEEIELFEAAGEVGTLVLPAGAPDRRAPAIVILHGSARLDDRASLYTDELLGAGFAVLEMVYLPDGSLETVLTALALHPRVAGQPLGFLGFGAGARLAAVWPGPIGARALLYPGCDGLVPAMTRGEAVLIMHGAADPVNEAGACAMLGQATGPPGIAVRLGVFERASYAWARPSFSRDGHSLLPRPVGPGRVASVEWPELAVLSASEVAGFFVTSLLSPAR